MQRSPSPRLFIDAPLHVAAAPYELPREAAHHLSTVLRAREGSLVTLFNGLGGEFEARLTEVRRRSVRCEIVAFHALERRSPLAVHLVQALARGTRMDLVMQKATELGAASIQPLAAARSNVKLDAERADDRLAHWTRITIAACEQCGRNDLPEVRPVVDLSSLLSATGQTDKADWLLFADPEARLRISDLLRANTPAPSAIRLVIGPEGGLCAEEIEALAAANARGLSLGPRVLRTETAGLAALAALQAQFGDL